MIDHKTIKRWIRIGYCIFFGCGACQVSNHCPNGNCLTCPYFKIIK